MNLFSSRDPETKLEIAWDESLYTSVKGLTSTVTFSILLLIVRIIYFFRRCREGSMRGGILKRLVRSYPCAHYLPTMQRGWIQHSHLVKSD